MKFTIENLSSGQADCFLINLENDLYDKCTILVDGNREGSKTVSFMAMVNRIASLEKLDYIVITHVDNDHLGGILSLFKKEPGITPDISQQLKDTIIIYNYVAHGEISYKQARILENLIHDRKVINSFSQKYENNRSMLKFLPLSIRKILEFTPQREQNAYFTFLGPNNAGANAVMMDYNRCYWEGSTPNSELINKNSITFLLEFAGKRVLFSGDAFLSDVETALCNIEDPKNPLKIDLIKIPHHGAKDNNSAIGYFSKKHKCIHFLLTAKTPRAKDHPDEIVIQQLYLNNPRDTKIYTELDLTCINTKYKYISENRTKTINMI